MLFVIVFCLFTAVLPVMADSVWTPMDDYFMTTWGPESDNTCKPLVRPYYLAAGEKGYAAAVKTPLDHTVLKTYPNGTEFKIAFICGKGDNLWGAVEAVRMSRETVFREDWRGESGYIAFSDLVRAYDTEAFKEDHEKELASVGEDDFNICSSGGFVLWQTPNSGVQAEYINESYLSYLCMDFDESIRPENRLIHFDAFYRDPDGNRWAEVTLRRVTETGWINLDHLMEGGVEPNY